MPQLSIRNVGRRFGELKALDEVSIDIEAGEFFTLLGPSGCGKTTLLRQIAGFDTPDSGSIVLDGKDLAGVPPEKRPLHTVFQSYALFPHMTVAANVAFPLQMARRPAAEIARRVGDALSLVHLEDKGKAYPQELSGGQKQRVALARGLVNRPRLLLLDEPLGALDAKLRVEMQVDLIRLQREVGITFVFVTHAQQEALALSQRIAVMNRGRIEQIDTPERLYSTPANRFVADFIGIINLFEGVVAEPARGHGRLRLDGLGEVLAATGAHPPGTRGTLGLRPEQLRIRASPSDLHNRFSGRVTNLLYRGDITMHTVTLDSGKEVNVLLPNAPGGARRAALGDTVDIAWRQDVGVFLTA